MIWGNWDILSLKIPPKKIDEIYTFHSLLIAFQQYINYKTYEFHQFS